MVIYAHTSSVQAFKMY